MKWITPVIYLAAITAAELLTVSLNPVTGVIIYLIIFLTLVIHTAITWEKAGYKLLVTLTLVPLIRVISLSLPLPSIPQILWYPIVYTPLLATSFLVARMLGYRLSDIGFQMKRVSLQLAFVLTGFVIGFLEYFILVEEAEATGRVMQETWLLSALVLVTTTGFVEELMFRGVLQRSTDDAMGWWGIVYTSFLFAIVHWIHGSVLDIIFVFAVALIFGWMVKKTGSLFGVTLAHGIANITLFLIVPQIF